MSSVTINNGNTVYASSIDLSAQVIPNQGNTYFDVMYDSSYVRLDRVSKPAIHISANFDGTLETIAAASGNYGSVLNIGTHGNNVSTVISDLTHGTYYSHTSYKLDGILQLPFINGITQNTATQTFTMAGYFNFA